MRAASLCAHTQPMTGVSMAGHVIDPCAPVGRPERSVTARELHLHGTRRHSGGIDSAPRRGLPNDGSAGANEATGAIERGKSRCSSQAG
eukprot:3830156-Prymnesium_polylepis.2